MKKLLLKKAIVCLTALVACVAFSACKDEVLIQAEVVLPEDANLMELEQWSYSIPFEIKSDSEWKIDFAFDDAYSICYVFPKEGTGNAVVKLCVLDNWTDERRTGEMYITFPEDESKNQVVQLAQKCNLDNSTNPTDVSKGDRIYAVGYGYNYLGEYASARSVSRSPIVRIEECSNRVQSGPVDATFQAKTYTGSSVTELSNDLSADASFGGSYCGFKGEIGATFNKKDFSNNSHEYAITYVEVAQQNVYLEMDHAEIIMEYMTDAAYNAINGLDVVGKRGTISTPYPSTVEGLGKLVQDYGTHLVTIARLGGRLKYSMTVDISKVESKYDLHAYANCSYKNSFVKASANVSDDLKSSYNKNSKACEVNLQIQGGGNAEALALGSNNGDNDNNIKAWQASLKDITNQTLVGLDIKQGLIPLYDLVNTDLPGGTERKQALKAYITGDTKGLEELTATALGIDMNYETGTVAHIAQIPTFDEGTASNSLIKNISIGGQVVARLCEEFIPVIDNTKRVKVFYPVVSNKVKYNMGYFIGDATHKPAKVCWEGASVSITESREDSVVGAKTELYVRGSSFTSNRSNDETIESTATDFKWSGPGYNESYNYPLVKIFNKIWLRENYKANRKEDGDKFGKNYNLEPIWGTYNSSSQCFYSEQMALEKCSGKYQFTPTGWRTPQANDYLSIITTLQQNNVQLSTGQAFYPDKDGGLLGFHHIYVGFRMPDSNAAYHVGDSQYIIAKEDGSYDGTIVFNSTQKTVSQHWWSWKDYHFPVRFVQDIE